MRATTTPFYRMSEIGRPAVHDSKISVAVQIRSLIERQIDEGRLKPGDRIAPERELARQLGASRAVVRSALEDLKNAGRITRHVGRGTLVSAAAPRPKIEGLSLTEISPLELLEFRLAFEPGLAEAIVVNANSEDLRSIRTCVEEGDAARVFRQWELFDRAFHQQLVAASHNKLAIAVYVAVMEVRHEAPWLARKRASTDTSKWRGFQLEHRAIADALDRRDARAAGKAIKAHLAHVRQCMLDH